LAVQGHCCDSFRQCGRGTRTAISSATAFLPEVWPYATPMANKLFAGAWVLWLTAFAASQSTTATPRPRAADLGLKVGILPAGPHDAISDVSGVEVRQTTIIRGDNIRTGVTAVLPHSGNLYREKVPGRFSWAMVLASWLAPPKWKKWATSKPPSC
jgi:Peptidase family S58